MLAWAIMGLVLALIAGLFGFGAIASASAGAARVVFGVGLAMFLASLALGVLGGA